MIVYVVAASTVGQTEKPDINILIDSGNTTDKSELQKSMPLEVQTISQEIQPNSIAANTVGQRYTLSSEKVEKEGTVKVKLDESFIADSADLKRRSHLGAKVAKVLIQLSTLTPFQR